MLKFIRWNAAIIITGAMIGFIGERRNDTFFDMLFDAPSLQAQMLKGNCIQPDARGKPYMFPCADYFIATKLQTDAADEETGRVLANMAANQPVKRKRP